MSKITTIDRNNLFTFRDDDIFDLYQWDTGVYLKFDEQYANYRVNFSNDKKKAYSRNIDFKSEVRIPDFLLQVAKPLEVYLMVDNKDGTYVKLRKILRVLERAKPEDYITDEEEIKLWEQKVDKLAGPDKVDSLLIVGEDGYIDFISNDDLFTNYYNKNEVDLLVNSIPIFQIKTVAELPPVLEASPTTIYLVSKDEPGSSDVYDEYIFEELTKTYELIGSTRVDLSGYALTSYVDAEIGKIKGITSGEGKDSEIFNDVENNQAKIDFSHAEGYLTKTVPLEDERFMPEEYKGSHAEGYGSIASGPHGSHAEGSYTEATGPASHAEGDNSGAAGFISHAEGDATYSNGHSSHSEGYGTYADGDHSHAEGDQTSATGAGSHSEGSLTEASGDYSHAEGENSMASGRASHAEGRDNKANGRTAHAEGFKNIANGNYSHAEGHTNTANGDYSHVEGKSNIIENSYGHAEGYGNSINATYSHAEGYENVVNGVSSHGEGYSNKVSGNYSHAEGTKNETLGMNTHAEGYNNVAEGDNSHAEGESSMASGRSSHVEGEQTIANGRASHAEGAFTVANGGAQHVQGRYNIEDQPKEDETLFYHYAHIVGNGTSKEDRSNAYTLDWDGNAWFAGDVYVGSTSGTNKDDGSKKLALAEDLEQLDTIVESLDGIINTNSANISELQEKEEELFGRVGTLEANIEYLHYTLDVNSGAITDIENKLPRIQSMVETNSSDIFALHAKNKELVQKIKEHQRTIDNLVAAAEGKLYRVELDTDEAYEKIIPSQVIDGKINSIGGKSIVLNQLNNNDYGTTTNNGVEFINNGDGTWATNGISDESTASRDCNRSNTSPYSIAGHKYLIRGCPKGGSYYKWNIVLYINGSGSLIYDVGSGVITTIDTSAPINLRMRVYPNVDATGLVWKPELIDLTLMFGTGNEPTTLEEAYEMGLPRDLIPYNLGEIVSASVNNVSVSVANLFDQANVLPASGFTAIGDYYFIIDPVAPQGKVLWENSDNVYGSFNIGADFFYESNDKAGVKFRTVYTDGTYKDMITSSDIAKNKWQTISITTDADKTVASVKFTYGSAGVSTKIKNAFVSQTKNIYTPFGERNNQIPQALIDRCDGYGWSTGYVYNEIDFKNKVYIQRVGEFSLSDVFTWTKGNNDVWYNRDNELKNIKKPGNSILSSKYVTSSETQYRVGEKEIGGHTSFTFFYIKDASLTEENIKNELKDVKVFYELAEPIITDISDLLTDDAFWLTGIEEGESIKFKQDGEQMPVPSEVSYWIKLGGESI